MFSGGETDLSENFVNYTVRELTSKGFIVSKDPKHSDIMGRMIDRRSTLSADKVIVRDMPYTGQPYTTTLSFPQVNK